MIWRCGVAHQPQRRTPFLAQADWANRDLQALSQLALQMRNTLP
jgi:hypothetical protein